MTTRRAQEKGSLAVWFAMLLPVFVAFMALVVNSGAQLAGNRAMTNAAEQAARVGAAELNQASLRNGGTPIVNTGAAVNAAQSYLSQVGVTGTVTVNGGVVSVTTSSDKPCVLPVPGWSTVHVHGSATSKSINSAGL